MLRIFLAFIMFGNKLHHLDPNKKNALCLHFRYHFSNVGKNKARDTRDLNYSRDLQRNLKGSPRNSNELQERNSEDLQRTLRNPEDLQGTPQNSKKLQRKF